MAMAMTTFCVEAWVRAMSAMASSTGGIDISASIRRMTIASIQA